MTQSTKAQDNLGLARQISSKYARRQRVEDTEQFSDASLGLIIAEQGYKPDSGCTFATYAHRVMRNQMINGHRQRRRQLDVVQAEVNELEVPVFDNADPEMEMARELLPVLLDVQQYESPRDQRNVGVLYEHYINGRSWQDIGEEMGLTRCCIMKYGQAGLKTVKARLQERLLIL